MTQDTSVYVSPLVERNASRQMAELFGADTKFRTWRRLWLELAKAQKKLGLKIADAQIYQMAAHLRISTTRRPPPTKEIPPRCNGPCSYLCRGGKAAPIIHLGATSCYVGDNADLIIMKGDGDLGGQTGCLIDRLAALPDNTALPTPGLHFQPAQLTTVGKRAALWCYDFVLDLEELSRRIETLPFRGVKGTTGTQASFLSLFNGNHSKVRRLDTMVARAFGFSHLCAVTGQTYPRKIDKMTIDVLASIAQSAHKMCNDIRLLANLKEIEEPFEKNQIGSSAMAYKRNPMRSERATGLARLVLSLAANPAMTAAQQWLERTLDDSSNRRVAIAEAFLATDGILEILINVSSGLVVYPKAIASHVAAELPFMATENILMAAVKAGGSRQDCTSESGSIPVRPRRSSSRGGKMI